MAKPQAAPEAAEAEKPAVEIVTATLEWDAQHTRSTALRLAVDAHRLGFDNPVDLIDYASKLEAYLKGE